MDLFQLLMAPRKATILTDSVRRKLHDRGWTDIHQSQLSQGRECPQRLHFALGKQQRTMSCHALLGSMFHRAIELSLPLSEMSQVEVWIYLMNSIIAEGNTTYFYRGSPLREADVIDFAHDLVAGRSIGVPVGELVFKVLDNFKQYGITVLAVEQKMTIIDGSQYPVSFTGTLDLLVQWAGKIGVLDCKTSGLWGPLLDGEGSVKKQGYSHEELFSHSQLRHYLWMRSVLGDAHADVIGLLTPSNLVPYKTGAEKGQPRGAMLLTIPAPSKKDVLGYQADVVNFLNRYVEGPYRAFPTNFGKPLCPGCPYYNGCIKDNLSTNQAAALSHPDLEYLK